MIRFLAALSRRAALSEALSATWIPGAEGQTAWSFRARVAFMPARRVLLPTFAAVSAMLLLGPIHAQENGMAGYKAVAARLVQAATEDDFAWRRLAELTDLHGARLSGSDSLSRAVVWSADAMRKDGLENVRTEPVLVPKW